MAGTPVWLASISRQNRITGGRLGVPLWDQQALAQSVGLLQRLLGPAGNTARERLFRMQITLCLHRALTAEEVEALPDWFHTAPSTDIAGGPVEILYETEEGLPSTKPCLNPSRHLLDSRSPLLWVPIDCEQCEPCLARLTHKGELDARDREDSSGHPDDLRPLRAH